MIKPSPNVLERAGLKKLTGQTKQIAFVDAFKSACGIREGMGRASEEDNHKVRVRGTGMGVPEIDPHKEIKRGR